MQLRFDISGKITHIDDPLHLQENNEIEWSLDDSGDEKEQNDNDQQENNDQEEIDDQEENSDQEEINDQEENNDQQENNDQKGILKVFSVSPTLVSRSMLSSLVTVA